MKIMKRYGLFTLAGAALLLSAAPVMAQDGGPPPEGEPGMEREHPKFPEGGITKSMFMEKSQERAEKHFEKMDKDGDGKLSREEVKSGFGKHKGKKHGDWEGKRRGGPDEDAE